MTIWNIEDRTTSQVQQGRVKAKKVWQKHLDRAYEIMRAGHEQKGKQGGLKKGKTPPGGRGGDDDK